MRKSKLLYSLLLVAIGLGAIFFGASQIDLREGVKCALRSKTPNEQWAAQTISAYLKTKNLDISPCTKKYNSFLKGILLGDVPELTRQPSVFVKNESEVEFVMRYASEYFYVSEEIRSSFGTEAPVFEAAPMTLDQQTTAACTPVIKKFLNSNPCRNWDEYHGLFSPSSRHFQSTPMPVNDPACNLKASVSVLRILTAEEWWHAENPDKPLPESAQPTLPNERVFFVETETKWQPGVIPAGQNPGKMLMRMEFNDDGTCLIRDFGW